MQVEYIIAGVMVFTGFVVGAGIIYSGLVKIAEAVTDTDKK